MNKNQKTKHQISKTQKGITLVALVITIIVLLILAVVAIRAIQNDSIINYAKNSVDEYERAQANEQSLLQGYIDKIEENLPAGQEPANSLVAMYKAGTLKVGDYVDYKVEKNADGTAKTYTPDGETVGSLTGYTEGSLQTITQEDLNWRVLGYDENKNELLLISGAPTTGGIHFYGHVAYNNYEDVLNDTCGALYGNSTIGATARSITMSDIDTYLGGSSYNKTTFGGGSTASGGYGYNNPSVSSYFSVGTDGKLTRVETPVTLNLTSNAYYYTASDVITDATKLEILQGKNVSKPYYIYVASRSVGVNSSAAGWCGDCVFNGDVSSYDICFIDSVGYGGSAPMCVRPVVSLGSKVTTEKVPILETAPTETWNDPLGMYTE